MKKIGILTTGGDCSGLNSTILRLTQIGTRRGHQMFGLPDGTDVLTSQARATMDMLVPLTPTSLPADMNRMSGSHLQSGNARNVNWRNCTLEECKNNTRKNLKALGLDALVIIGGNGSMSLSYTNKDAYAAVQLVYIPKTIDMDVPLTDSCIGFKTAVNELTKYADQILLTARSHHRWFVIQTMGRDNGFLALHAGIASNASAILIPESKWKLEDLIKHIKKQPTDYGIIMVSEGCEIRGHSGKPADIIVRELTKHGISSRAGHPEHMQRAGDTIAKDRILAATYANAAMNAIDNSETMVATLEKDNVVRTVPLEEIMNAGRPVDDPNIGDMMVTTLYVSEDDPLIQTAIESGIFIE